MIAWLPFQGKAGLSSSVREFISQERSARLAWPQSWSNLLFLVMGICFGPEGRPFCQHRQYCLFWFLDRLSTETVQCPLGPEPGLDVPLSRGSAAALGISTENS